MTIGPGVVFSHKSVDNCPITVDNYPGLWTTCSIVRIIVPPGTPIYGGVWLAGPNYSFSGNLWINAARQGEVIHTAAAVHPNGNPPNVGEGLAESAISGGTGALIHLSTGTTTITIFISI